MRNKNSISQAHPSSWGEHKDSQIWKITAQHREQCTKWGVGAVLICLGGTDSHGAWCKNFSWQPFRLWLYIAIVQPKETCELGGRKWLSTTGVRPSWRGFEIYLTRCYYVMVPSFVVSRFHPLVLCNVSERCGSKQPRSTSESWTNKPQQALVVPGIEQNELERLSLDQRVPVFLNTGHTCDLAVKKRNKKMCCRHLSWAGPSSGSLFMQTFSHPPCLHPDSLWIPEWRVIEVRDGRPLFSSHLPPVAG